MALTGPCRCGAPRFQDGQCTHCDRANLCPSTCAHCRRRDEHCLICRRDCGTKTAAEICQTNHRKIETQQRA